MRKYLKYFGLIIVLVFVNCNAKKESQKQEIKQEIKQEKQVAKTSKEEKVITEITEEKEHEGKKLLETKCFVCHNVSTPKKNRIAPPMIAVKAHYIQKNTKKEDFIKEFTSFVTNPTKEKVKMHGAVKKFGVMPKQVFEQKDIEKIANYLFDYKIAEPSWFQKHWQEHKGKTYFNQGKISAIKKQPKSKAEIGLSYALGTKKVLGKNLMGTIQKKGTVKALQFCNEKAYKLTDSMALKYNAKIKRVSDKPRNPENIANIKELKVIENYKKIIANKQKITPIIENNKATNQTTFYYPIVTNAMCLQCHGKPKTQIAPETLTKLTHLYPKDKAVNYDINQVRGIWSITYNN